MRKQIKRSFYILFAMLLATNIFTACLATKEEKETIQEIKQAEVTEEDVVEEKTPEPTSRPTPEPTLEPISYEGIDMESTLSGIEWISTFENNINEPKFVIFNDASNKKVIVESGTQAEFSEGDYLCVYTPNNLVVVYAEIKTASKDDIYGTL